MTYEDLKAANAKAYMEEKRTGYPQVIVVPAHLVHLLINVAKEANLDAEGRDDDPTAMPSYETIEALNALDDYVMESAACHLH